MTRGCPTRSLSCMVWHQGRRAWPGDNNSVGERSGCRSKPKSRVEDRETDEETDLCGASVDHSTLVVSPHLRLQPSPPIASPACKHPMLVPQARAHAQVVCWSNGARSPPSPSPPIDDQKVRTGGKAAKWSSVLRDIVHETSGVDLALIAKEEQLKRDRKLCNLVNGFLGAGPTYIPA